MKQKNYNSFQDWDISQGDYQRNREDTFKYQKQIRRKQIVKKSTYALLFVISLITAFILLAIK